MATIKDFTPPPEDGATGDVMQAHAKVWPYLQAPVELCARELTKDRFKRRELIQEGRLELWRIDATRFGSAVFAFAAHLRKASRCAMLGMRLPSGGISWARTRSA